MKYKLINKNNKSKSRNAVKRIKETINKFMLININFLNDKINQNRMLYLNLWKTKPYDKMVSEGLPSMTYSQGVKEIEEEFNLQEPDSIIIEILENMKSNANNGEAAMETYFKDRLKPIIYVYLDCFSDDLVWRGESIENVFLHELLHAYGEVKNDGLIRYNMIGVATINEILNES